MDEFTIAQIVGPIKSVEEKMTRFLILVVALSLHHTAAAQTQSADRFITSFAEKHNFSGTIVIQKNGRLRYAKSFGFANLKFKNPNTRW